MKYKFIYVVLAAIIFTFTFSSLSNSAYAKTQSSKKSTGQSNKDKNSKSNGVKNKSKKKNKNKKVDIVTPTVPSLIDTAKKVTETTENSNTTHERQRLNTGVQLIKTNTLEHGTEQFVINEINDVSSNARNFNSSFKYTAWYFNNGIYYLTGNVSINTSSKSITFEGFICKDKKSNKSDVSFTKAIGGGYTKMVVGDSFKEPLMSILNKCDIFTVSDIGKGIQNYFRVSQPASKTKYKDAGESKNYGLLKPDDSIIIVSFSSSNKVLLVQRYFGSEFVDQIENFTIDSKKSSEAFNDSFNSTTTESKNKSNQTTNFDSTSGFDDSSDFGDDSDFDDDFFKD